MSSIHLDSYNCLLPHNYFEMFMHHPVVTGDLTYVTSVVSTLPFDVCGEVT